MKKNQKGNSRKKTLSIPFGRKRPFWRKRECRVPPAQKGLWPRGKKLDSTVSSIPCQARDRLKQAYQVRNDRIFKVISGNIDNTKRAKSCNIAFRVPLFKMY